MPRIIPAYAGSTARDGVLENLVEGIIPAYAGSTVGEITDDWPDGDHPRVCGEHFPSVDYIVRCQGSSPRMRGALRT